MEEFFVDIVPILFDLFLVAFLVFMNGFFVASEFAILGVGSLVAFLVSLADIKFLVGFVRKHDFKPFGVYRIILGIVVLGYFVGMPFVQSLI